MSSEKEVAIYYPYIDLTNGELIKTAALYWDELQTIVPESVQDPYQSPASREAYELGFLQPRIVNPEDNVVDKSGREFANDIQEETIRQRVVSLIRKTKRKRFTKVHFDKWAATHLTRVWLALRDEVPLSPMGDNLLFPEPLGNSYMSRLASAIAQHDQTVPLTELSSYHDILIDRYADYGHISAETQAELAKVSLQAISIRENVPLVRILKFRDKHRDELANLRRSIRNLSRQVSSGPLEDKHELIEQIVKDEVLPSKEEIEGKLTEKRIAFNLSSFDIVQSAFIGLAASGAQNWLTGIAAGTISLATTSIKAWRQDRNIIREHPFGYLYKAQRQFGNSR